VTAKTEPDDVLKNQLYLAKFANVSMDYSDRLTLRDLRTLCKQVEKWEKEISKAKVKLEESKLKSLFKGLSKMWKKR